MEQELQQEVGLEDSGEQQQEQQETMVQPDAQRMQEEERARETGWVPESEFRGDKRKYRGAKEWNRHADTMLPIANAANRKLEAKIAALEAELAGSKDTLTRIAQTQDKFSGDFYDTELSEIRVAIERAVEAGDVDIYKTLREREAKLVKPEPIQPSVQKQDEVHPAVAKWRAENLWFDPEYIKGDDDMTAYALSVGNLLAKKNDPVSAPGKESEFCQKVSKMVKARFPEKFSNPNRGRTEIDESGLRGGEQFASDNSTKDWNHLPAAAKAACMKQITANPKITKEVWTKYYYEQEEA